MMKKVRLNDLARELEVKPGKLLEALPALGVKERKTHSSSVDEDVAEELRELFRPRFAVGAPDATDVLAALPDTTEELGLEPDVLARLRSIAEEISEFRAAGSLEGLAARKLEQSFRLQHVYHSTGIEGNRLTLRETEVVLRKGIQIAEKPLQDQMEVRDLDAALDFLSECTRREEPLRETTLRELHALVVRGQADASPGSYRQTGVVISGSELKPPEPLAVPGLVQQLVSWINQPKSVHPLACAIIAHHKLAVIHPFLDGNGRVARLLANLVLLRSGYPIVNIRRDERPRYYEALTQADHGKYGPLLGLAIDRALETFGEMKRIREETERMKSWAAELGQREAATELRRQERDYKLWLSQMETLRLEFQSRAELLDEELHQIQITFKAYPAPDLSKYLQLRERGVAPQSWFFLLRFTRNNEPFTFFFRFFRDRKGPWGGSAIPLEANWFENGEEKPVSHPAIGLRELWVDSEQGWMVRRLEAGQFIVQSQRSLAAEAERFFEEVLRVCCGIG